MALPSPSPALTEPETYVAGRQYRLTARALYFFYFAAFGVFVTYVNIYYRRLGLSGVQIGSLNAIAPVIGILASTIWGLFSDRYGQAKRLMAIAGLGTILAAAGLASVRGYLPLFALTAAFALFSTPLLPLLDSSALKGLLDRPEGYGRERVWGSLGFIVSSWGFGFVLQAIGLPWLFGLYIAMILAMLLTLRRLPEAEACLPKPGSSGIVSMLGNRNWRLFAVSVLLIGIGTNALHDFSGIYLVELGAGEALIGTVAGVGVLTELPVLFWGAPLLARWGSWRLLLFAYAVSMVRWTLFSLIPAPGWAIPISLLHSITFGVYWIAGVSFVDALAPVDWRATAQGLFYSLMGLSRALGGPLNGYIFDGWGAARLFQFSAAMALLAIVFLYFGVPRGRLARGLLPSSPAH